MKSKVQSDKIHLLNVQMLQGGLETSDEFQKEIVLPSTYDISIGHREYSNREDQQIAVRLEVTLTGLKKDDQSKKEVKAGIEANYIYHFYFKVENLKDFDNDGKMDASIMTTLLSISYSTLRGIILERTSGTMLNGVILPIINPVKLLKEHAIPTDSEVQPKSFDNKK